MGWRRQRRRAGYEMLVIPNDGRPARAWNVRPTLIKTAIVALIINIVALVGLSFLTGTQQIELVRRANDLNALNKAHHELLATTEEQEHQLHELALEAERLALRVRELEELSDEVWTLLGEQPSKPTQVAEIPLGQGGPDDGTHDVGMLAAILLNELAHQVPVQLRELQQLRESVLSRNHRLDHTPSIWPVEGGYVSSEFGARIHPISGNAQRHEGIDIAAWTGTPVHATAAGTVTFAGNRGGYGLTVVIDHGYGVQTLYAHNSRLHVRVGQKVKRGDLISSIGTTGVSTGPHLHYEVHVNGRPVNPRNYLP